MLNEIDNTSKEKSSQDRLRILKSMGAELIRVECLPEKDSVLYCGEKEKKKLIDKI